MTQISLERASVHAAIRQCITTGMTQHMRVHRETKLCLLTPPRKPLPEPEIGPPRSETNT
jgi:hypothetical protein